MTSDQFNNLLPDFLRDFHDQKDFFKAIHTHYSKEGLENKIPGNWVDNHIYTIDFFLWFMALHGYRLQRFKSKQFEQYDPVEFVEEYNNIRRGKSTALLTEILSKSKQSLGEE